MVTQKLIFTCPIFRDQIVDFIVGRNFKTYFKGLFKNSLIFCFTDKKQLRPVLVKATQIICGTVTLPGNSPVAISPRNKSWQSTAYEA